MIMEEDKSILQVVAYVTLMPIAIIADVAIYILRIFVGFFMMF